MCKQVLLCTIDIMHKQKKKYKKQKRKPPNHKRHRSVDDVRMLFDKLGFPKSDEQPATARVS